MTSCVEALQPFQLYPSGQNSVLCIDI